MGFAINFSKDRKMCFRCAGLGVVETRVSRNVKIIRCPKCKGRGYI